MPMGFNGDDAFWNPLRRRADKSVKFLRRQCRNSYVALAAYWH